MPHRPRISLRVPRVILPGQPFEAVIALDVASELHIDRVTARLTGSERVRVGSGKSARTQRDTFIDEERVLSEAATLAPGPQVSRYRFTLPRSSPPSYWSPRVQVEYEMRVHVDIPWWPDARKRFALHVGSPPGTADPPGASTLFAYPPGGPRADEAAFEGSLAGTVLVPSGNVRGAIALFNIAARRYRGITVSLVGQEQRAVTTWTGIRTEESVVERHPAHYLPPSIDGEPVPFTIDVPADVTASTLSRLWRLDWFVEIELDLPWAFNPKVRTPVTIVPADPGAPSMASPAPPSVGSPRLARLWLAAAGEVGMSFEHGALRARMIEPDAGEVDVTVAREHRGRAGTHLVARLHHAPFHLGLYTHKGQIKGRDAAQVRAFLAQLGPRPADLASMSDEETRLERKDSGQHRERLVLFAHEALGLAGALARAFPHLPVPTPHANLLPEWQELASRLGGLLQRGRLAVAGELRGMPAEVEMRWASGGDPLGVRLTLRPAHKLGDPTRSQMDGGGELTVTQDAITLDLPPPEHPLDLMARLVALYDLAQRLVPTTPYR